MTEQEEKVLKLCRYWYQTASDISRQTLWYEIGVLLENERGLTKRAADICPRCEGVGQYVDYIGKRVCSLCDGTGKCR